MQTGSEETYEVLTLAQAAQLLQVAEQTVRNELTAGRLPGRKVGKVWRLSRAALTAYVATSACWPTSTTGPRS